MTKVTRTYLSGCTWCNATGTVQNPTFDPNITGNEWVIICPVCNGSKVITVTEEYDDSYEVDYSKIDNIINPIGLHYEDIIGKTENNAKNKSK